MEERRGRIGAVPVEGEKDLRHLMERLFPDSARCCYIREKVEEIDFGRGRPPEVWKRGRLFSVKSELRWKMIGEEKFQTQFLCEGEFPPDHPFEITEEEWQVSEDKPILLWGERKEGRPYWVEVRVPRALEYPLEEPGQQAVIITVDYLGPRWAVQFTRFKEVKRYGSR